jgi:hypothetical protein
MLVQIKWSRLFAGFFSEVVAKSRTNACPDQVVKTVCWFFSEVVARSRTNACPNQGLKTLCWFFFQKLLRGQEPTLVQIKKSRFFAGFFFQKLLVGQEPMFVQIKRSRLFAGLFLEVIARSRTNACPNQVVKTVYFFPNQKHLDDYNLIYFAP